MLRRSLTLLATVTVTTTHLAAIAPAQQTFAKRSQVINAGVVILDSSRNSTGDAVSAAPYAWFNLDSNKTVKPAGWTLVNPHHKSVMDATERQRWYNIHNSLSPVPPAAYAPPNSPPARYTKRHAAYWEVRLNQLSEAQIADYDVLLVAPVHSAQVSPGEREKLRRFVDKGGILWIDPSVLGTNQIDPANSFPIPTGLDTVSGLPQLRDLTQPLISGPQPLSIRDLTVLSTAPGSNFAKDLIRPTVESDMVTISGGAVEDFGRMRPVVGEGPNRYSIGVSRIGDGFVVYTSRAIAMKLNRVRMVEDPQNFGYTTNLTFLGREPNLQTDGLAAAKFAVNLISLARESSQPQGGSQRSGGSPIDVGAPLIKRMQDDVPGLTEQPVLYKGFLVVTMGDRLRVYDADPARDFDGDGNTDDGYPDVGFDGRDLIWESADINAGDFSSPVCVEVPNSRITRADNSIVTDLVLVTDNQTGALHAFDLIRYNAGGTLFIDNGTPAVRPEMTNTGYNCQFPITPPGSASFDPAPADEHVHAPTVHEGIAYMTERTSNGGRVWMANLATGAPMLTGGNRWSLGGGTSALPLLSAAATIGYIPILDNSGGVDRVLYAPTPNIPAAGGTGGQPAGFASIWLGAKGERPAEFTPGPLDPAAGGLTVTTRAGREGLPIYMPGTGMFGNGDSNGIRISVIKTNGDGIYSTGELRSLFAGTVTQPSPGVLFFAFRNGNQTLPNTIESIRVDYTIDFGNQAAEMSNAKRGDIQLPDNSTNSRRVIDTLTLTPRGTLYMTVSDPIGRSALFGFREEGRGSFRCVMRYELYMEHSMGGQGLTDQVIPGLFQDQDPVQDFVPAILKQPFANFNFRSAPVVRGDVLYAVAAGTKAGFGAPAAVVMAFQAEPETPSIYLDNFPTNGQIVQPDIARSNIARRPEVVPGFQAGQVPGLTYDEELKLLRIENLATATKGQLQAVINLSQPILVRTPGGGTADRLIYPNGNNAANRFDPLLWYAVVNGYQPGRSSLAITGSTLFMGGSTPIRSFINGTGLVNEGQIMAFDTEISPTNEWLVSATARPWMRQLLTLRAFSPRPPQFPTGGLEGNPAQRWPLLDNIVTGSDFLVRLNQAVVPGAEVNGIAAGEGVLAAVGSGGLFSYSRSDFLVADQGRIAAFDPGGSPTFELTTTGNAGEAESGTSGAGRPVVQPSRAYPLPNNEILVADPGANRVFRVNRAGTETRAISKFRLDPGRAPANYPANGSLNLNAPRDVTSYTTIKTQAEVQNVFTSGGAAYEYWTHYLIADTGNRRLVEVVDRYQYDPVDQRIRDVVTLNGVPQLGVLLWHSPSAVNGKGFDYNSVSRVWVNDRYIYFAGIGSALPTATDTGTRIPAANAPRETAGYGGVVVFDSSLPNGVAVINSLAIPSFGANVFWNEGTAAFDAPARAAVQKPLINVASVTARTFMLPGTPRTLQVAVMVTDASGVYEFAYVPPAAQSEYVPPVQWMLPNEAYRVMRRGPAGPFAENPRDLRALYARRLESGEVILVNGYFGQTRGTSNGDGTFLNRQPFRGEVVQIDGMIRPNLWTATNMGFGNMSLTYRLELNKETRGLVLPVFADRR